MYRSLTILCAFLVGCSGPEVTQVTGQILLEGEPFNKASVRFWPKDDLKLGVFSTNQCDDLGRFEIKPEPEHGQGRAGIYVVLVADKGFSLRPKVHHKYRDKATTPFEVEIEPGAQELEAFDVDKNPGADEPFDAAILRELGR